MTPSTDPKYPDEETRQIVEEMEKQGKKLDFLPVDGSEPTKEEPPKEEPAPQKEPEPAKEEPPKEESAPIEAKTEEKPMEEPRRQVLIPIARVKQREKEIRRESEAKISELTNQVKSFEEKERMRAVAGTADAGVQELSGIASKIADAHGASPELIKDILSSVQSLAKQGTEIPKELTDAIRDVQQIKTEHEERKEVEQTLSRFEDEFAQQISSNGDLSAEIRSSGLTLGQFKERLQDVVLGEQGERYAKLTLAEVYMLKKSDLLPKKAKSADAPHGRVTSGISEPDVNEIPSVSELKDMSDEEFEKMSNNLGKKSKLKITRNGRPI